MFMWGPYLMNHGKVLVKLSFFVRRICYRRRLNTVISLTLKPYSDGWLSVSAIKDVETFKIPREDTAVKFRQTAAQLRCGFHHYK